MTTTALKLLALALMFCDHIYEFIGGAPIWLTWLGRLSAPLFLFCMVWGVHYTHDRKHYLKGLYFWGVFMAVGDLLLAWLLPGAKTAPMNNIFVTFLLVGMVITIIEGFRGKGDRSEAKKLLWLLILAQVASIVLVPMAILGLPQIENAFVLPASVFPSLLFCEGGPIWILLGLMLYYTKENKRSLAVSYLAFSLLVMAMGGFGTLQDLFYQNYQWLMVLSLPFMLCYNGEKGRGLKRLFYVFYPAHVFILCWLGSFVAFG